MGFVSMTNSLKPLMIAIEICGFRDALSVMVSQMWSLVFVSVRSKHRNTRALVVCWYCMKRSRLP